ncbi:MAG: isocitrate/isopropylmalate dehydrogenase family protein [Pseudomonadales bacterium]|nr:isocitrate/isopropylmalate dehydrogenase family protein [Pseudomonadales bacterium]
MSSKTVAVIEGDDAAPEAVAPTINLVRSLDLDIDFTYPIVGEPAIEQFGTPLPEEAKAMIDDADTTFFGSTSGSSGVALLYLRWGKVTYANVRPSKYFPGAPSALAKPEGIDFIIVRENLEDLYLRTEGHLQDLSNLGLVSKTSRKPLAELGEGRYAIKAITRDGSERVLRFAFELARTRRHKLTVTSKYNMLPETDGYFLEIAKELAQEYDDVEMNHYIVDDFACRLVANPHQFDVTVMPNLYGDILSDAAAGLVGGLGLAASGCYGDDYAYFESAHGTAPDIAGQNIINPTANLLTAAMMLNYLDFSSAAERLNKAITKVYASGDVLTPDVGGTASTNEMCDAVRAAF